MIPKREYRVLTQDEIETRRKLGLSLDPREVRKYGLVLPVIGAEEDDDNKDDKEEKEEKESEDDESEDDKKEKKPKGSKSEEDDEDDDEDTVKLPKNEVARLRRKAKQADDLEKKEKKAKEDADRKKKQDEGRWQELVDEEKETTRTEKERADNAEKELAKFKFKVNVSAVAQRLNFQDPTDAFRFLDEEEFLDAEEDVLEGALTKVLKKKTYLKGDRRASGGGSNGRKNGEYWDIDSIKKMSEDEINKNWDKPGFQEALKNLGM